MEGVQLGDIGEAQGVGQGNVCIANESGVLVGARRGWTG
jgi:hypothetical protein